VPQGIWHDGLQFGKKIGVSKQHWIANFGADYVIGDYDKVVEKVDEITEGFKFAWCKDMG
jgi:hypothetical protein